MPVIKSSASWPMPGSAPSPVRSGSVVSGTTGLHPGSGRRVPSIVTDRTSPRATAPSTAREAPPRRISEYGRCDDITMKADAELRSDMAVSALTIATFCIRQQLQSIILAWLRAELSGAGRTERLGCVAA